MEPLGQYPDPTHVVAHLSDPHLLADRLLYDAVDTAAHLERALARLRRLPTPPQALVFTGDLADRAEPGAYARLRAIVEPVAADLGAEVVWVMGNHDERRAFGQALLGTDDDAPRDRVHDVAGLRIVALDTSVPGWHHGELGDDQLAWLADVLATPAPHGTLLAMHHPPIPVPMLRLAELIELHDQDRLAAVVEGTDVRGILGGHFHFTSYATFAGVPVSVASASCYTSELAPEGRMVAGVDGHQAFTMLHLYEDRVVHSVVPATDAVEVSGRGEELLEAFLALTPAERFDLVARKDSPLNAEPAEPADTEPS
ncbi:metallophosphoesterase [Pimelobacter simplex]|uniref:metallophosphoesterase n=1 Tax=Nocardioides simplex TaxID=2045 RepID=UPI002150403B|nr:metallophosphoesterase [Pimelobacter simplex]UUW88884.1 metallophosphoesterase [Pimelobacter simplex]UUW98389.1 metallophosphoesterase [Pimelobacter simplex]